MTYDDPCGSRLPFFAFHCCPNWECSRLINTFVVSMLEMSFVMPRYNALYPYLRPAVCYHRDASRSDLQIQLGIWNARVAIPDATFHGILLPALSAPQTFAQLLDASGIKSTMLRSDIDILLDQVFPHL